MLGPFNSSVAQAVQPVLGEAGVVQVSPGSTATSLTRGANAVTAPLRQYQTFFRTVATDAVQGPAAATYLSRTENKRRVAVVSDGKTYGEGIAEEFAKQLATQGGQVVARVPGAAGHAARPGRRHRGRRPTRRGVLRRRVPGGRPAVGRARRRGRERAGDGR